MWRELIKIWTSHSLLDQAWTESFEMLEIDRTMFKEAVRVLRQSDEPGSGVRDEIRALDKRVNKYERDVRRKVMTHCTVEGASELPSGMVLVSVVIDIERVGDYCKNILDLADAHPMKLKVDAYEEGLQEIEAEVLSRFDKTIEVLRNHDVDGARQMMRTYKKGVGKLCDEIVDNMVKGKTDGIGSGEAAGLALYVRYLKRISAHLNNMATGVVNPFHRLGFKEKTPKKTS